MGRVMTKLKVSNVVDCVGVAEGSLPQERVRSVEIDALVDTGATQLALPEEVVRAVGARIVGHTTARDARGVLVELPWVGALRIEILGREMDCDALMLPEGATPLIGQIPLERLDLIVDPKSRDLRVNPASPDVPLLDLMAVA